MIEQAPFGTNNFADNPEPRVACVLLLDISGSMGGAPIAELNAGLTAYRDSLAANALAAKRVEVALVTFGGQVQTICDFTTAEGFHPPTLTAGGDTPMGSAIRHGLEMLRTERTSTRRTGSLTFGPGFSLLLMAGRLTSGNQPPTRSNKGKLRRRSPSLQWESRGLGLIFSSKSRLVNR